MFRAADEKTVEIPVKITEKKILPETATRPANSPFHKNGQKKSFIKCY